MVELKEGVIDLTFDKLETDFLGSTSSEVNYCTRTRFYLFDSSSFSFQDNGEIALLTRQGESVLPFSATDYLAESFKE